MHILRCMGSKFCVKFQRAPLKFNAKFWTHTPQNMHFTVSYFCVWVTIYLNCDVISLSEPGPSSIWPGNAYFPLINVTYDVLHRDQISLTGRGEVYIHTHTYVFIAFMSIYMNVMCISYGVLSVACIHLVCAWAEPGVGVTKPISSVPLFSEFFSIVKTTVSYWISHLYLAAVGCGGTCQI